MNLFFIFGNNSRLDNLLLKLTDLWNIRIEVQSHNEFGPTVFSLSANRVLFSNTWGRLGHMRRKKMLTHALYCLAFAESSLLSFHFFFTNMAFKIRFFVSYYVSVVLKCQLIKLIRFACTSKLHQNFGRNEKQKALSKLTDL